MRQLWTLFAALLFAAALFASERREDRDPAPSSDISRAQAIADAIAWMRAGSGRIWKPVSDTGSMVPTLDSRSILLLELVDASRLRVHDLAVYTRNTDGSGTATIVHRVMEVRPDGVLFEGDANRGSDGWIAPRRIRYRVAGVIFTNR